MAVGFYIASLVLSVLFMAIGCVPALIVTLAVCAALLIRHELLWLVEEAVYRSLLRSLKTHASATTP